MYMCMCMCMCICMHMYMHMHMHMWRKPLFLHNASCAVGLQARGAASFAQLKYVAPLA